MLDHDKIDYDSIYKYAQYQTPQGHSGRTPPGELNRGNSMFKTTQKNSDMLQSTIRANETTMAGDSPAKYKASSGMKNAPFRNTILDHASINSSEAISHFHNTQHVIQ